MRTILCSNLSQKWSKSWIQKSPSKSYVPYRKTTFKNNFRSGGQKPSSHMEAKLAQMPIKSFSVLGPQKKKCFFLSLIFYFEV